MAVLKKLGTDGKPVNPRKPWTARYWVQEWDAKKNALVSRQREKSFATKKEAADFLAHAEHSKRTGDYTDPKLATVNFGVYADEWIAKRPAQATRYSYHLNLTKHGAILRGRTLAAVARDREGVQRVLDAAPPGCRVNLRNSIVGPVRQAQKDGRITSHRLAGLDVPAPSQKASCHMVSWTELTTLSGKLGDHWGLLADVMWGLGVRIGEALALTRESFIDDPVNGHLCRVSVQRTGRTGTTAPKRRQEGDFRDVPVPDWLWVKVEHRTGDLFPAQSRANVTKRMRTALDAVGLESTVPHDLRHAFASHMLGAGIPLPDVARYLGHRDINLTYQTYSHFIPDSFGRAREVMTRLAS